MEGAALTKLSNSNKESREPVRPKLEDYEKMVYRIYNLRFSRTKPEDRDDYIQVGFERLLDCLTKWTPEKDKTFTSYVYSSIQGEMQNLSRKIRVARVPIPHSSADKVRTYYTMLSEGFTPEEMAESGNITKDQIYDIVQLGRSVYLNSHLNRENGTTVELTDILEDTLTDNHYRNVECTIILIRFIDRLVLERGEKYAEVIEHIADGYNAKEVASKTGYSLGYIYRILQDCRKRYYSLFKADLYGHTQ